MFSRAFSRSGCFSSGQRTAGRLIIPEDGTEVRLEEGFRYLINVGSVGQPRDGDPRACYVLFQPELRLISYHRVQYPLIEVQEKMAEVGLPAFLIKRLAFGR
jgi:diadenosine tetraphosphatase ApaH/serine/threonine PP2A family protein phosphatase